VFDWSALLKGLVEFAGLLLFAQGAIFVLSFGRHETNPIYQLVRFLTSPIVKVVRRVTPSAIVDKHVPVVAFLLLFWIWVVLIFVRRGLLAQGGA